MEDTKFECRACLDTFEAVNLYNLFQTWNQLWEGLSDNVIATDLGRLAYIQLSEMDSYSKLICKPCLLKLKEACEFTAMVKLNDTLLMQRFIDINVPSSSHSDLIWPRPMQLEKNEVKIEQEILPDEEYSTIQYNSIDGNDNEDGNRNVNFPNLDIKLEPEELMQPPIQIVVNGTLAEDDYQHMGSGLVNGSDAHYEENNLDPLVKTEPLSEVEEESVSDLPLECMLCAKMFKKISGLKAHVIAQHSYKSVKRKAGGTSPQKNRGGKITCAICQRSFVTLTDLMVHETCHNKAVCYGCGQKCDNFQQLTKHRARCKALRSTAKKPVKPKTLEDVMRNQTLQTKEIETHPIKETLQVKEIEMLQEKEIHTFKAKEIQTLQAKEIQTLQAKEVQTRPAGEIQSIHAKEIKSKETKTDDMNSMTDNKTNLLERDNKSDTIMEFKEEPNSQNELEKQNVEIKEEYLPLFICTLCNEEFSDFHYLKIHEEISHGSTLIVNEKLKTMKTELLDSLFDDN